MPAETVIVYAGLAVACLGLVASLRPLQHLGLGSRRRGLAALAGGLVTAGLAAPRFAIYWRVIYPGSALIRRMWLDAIRRRAERGR